MTLKARKTLLHLYHRWRNRLGLPVDYADFEFDRAKAALDWQSIPAQRIRSVAALLDTDEAEVSGYVTEAEQIEAPNTRYSEPERFEGVGSPMGRTDRITLYALVRALKPAVTVETGTAAGAAALYMLRAFELNGGGRLFSIDASADRTNVGSLIPAGLRHRVEFFAGDSIAVLHDELGDLGAVDLFLHDSRHRYDHMTAEFEWALAHCSGRSVLASHDVLMGNAWAHFLKRNRNWVRNSSVVKNLGFCLLDTSYLNP
jgi:predicted O-methyltransferase YrrM